MARLQDKYKNEIVPELVKQFGYSSPQRAPRLEKITVNMGMGAAAQDGKLLDKAIEEMRLITGQQPVLGRARRSIANFKLRQGQAIGVYTTLRRDRMYEFFDRLITLALPRVRDFRGVNPNGFDHRGNYTMGIKEHTIFPEINLDQVDRIKGLNISIVTSAESDEEALALLKAFGVPFRK